ncbi:hypothetical protein [Nevskia soli]|jgi:hypothetical protein|uniref:hypothetical protein n=1 Tax=Nevskia soli TaxID=418856 RepID=UPI0015D83FAA|nr:hypothetical protein [Nevskia soli]
MESSTVFAAMRQLRVTTEQIERAQGTAEMERAIAERADAVQRVSTMVTRSTKGFTTADLTELRQLYIRGAAVLTGLERSRRDCCAGGARLDGMQHVLNSFRLSS